jgi:glycine/D-amino acid oxidase-like deaminating enzyme
MHEESVWSASLEPGPAGGPLPLEGQFDVAIVGAGLTGLSAAYALRKCGVSVAVLEREVIGFGASSRNGGMVLTGLKVGPDELLQRFGSETSRAMFNASLEAIDLVESLISTEGIECAFDRCGHIEVASKPAHLDAFKRTADVLERSFGHRVAILDRSALRDEVGSDTFFGGMLDERSAGLDPARYVAGLAHAVRERGGVIYEHVAVKRVTRSRDSWLVETPRGTLRVAHVIAATGAYTDAAFWTLKRRIVPLGSYVIATEPLSEDLARELIPRNRMVFDSRRLLHYFRRTNDRRLLFGGRAAFVPERRDTTRGSAKILQRDMVKIFPKLKDVRIEYGWGGTLDVAFDFMPHAGQMDGAAFALGYAGHGVALATLLGTRTGEAIAAGASLYPFESPLPKAPLGLYNGRPWFLPFVGALQLFLDWVN